MTPPVCVTAYAAAGVARADPLTVGFTAMRLGAIAYIVPYMFVYGQPLLMRGSVGQIAFSIVTAIIGIVCFCTGIYGWFFKKINYIERAVLIISGVLFIKVGWLENLAGLFLLGIIIGKLYYGHMKDNFPESNPEKNLPT